MTSARKGVALSLLLVSTMLFVSACSTRSPSPTPPSPQGTAQAVDPQVVEWLAANAIPFTTTAPGGDTADLEPLKRIIGNARLVALGESTHGTHEFFQMKHRLLEFLVREMGFSTLAMEVNTPQARLIDDYIQTGAGDPTRLLAGLGVWAWNTQEVLDMIEWMRAYNAEAATRTLSFYGFDMQSPHMTIDNLRTYLKQVEPSSTQFETALQCFGQYQEATFGYAQVPATKRQECRAKLQSVYDSLVSNRAAYVRSSSASQFELALHDARLVLQAEERYSSLANRDMRDLFMAENITWYLDHSSPGTKVVLWAHNSHVSAQLPMARSMGSYLHEALGDDFVTVGFDFYEGSFSAQTLDTQRSEVGRLAAQAVSAPAVDSYEAVFHSAGVSQFILDLNAAEPETVESGWLEGPHPFRSIGTTYDKTRPGDYVYDSHLPEEYDAIIYFDSTSPSQLLPAH